MRFLIKFTASLLLLLLLLFTQLHLSAASNDHWLLNDVVIIDINNGKLIPNSTILIKDGNIAAINPKSYSQSLKKVSGEGRFVIPGLSEMHAHVPNDPEYIERVLKLFIAHGVTNIRGMLGHPNHLKLRQQLNSGNKLGPYLVTSGPSINGNSVRSPKQAIATINEQVEAGYDFHKIHPGLSVASYQAVANRAQKLNSPWGGHISMQVGIVDTIKAGQATIDHMDGFIEELAARNGGDISERGFFGFALAHQVNQESISKLVEELASFPFAIVPTETLMRSIAAPGSTATLMQNPAHRWMPKHVISGWKQSRDNFWSNPAITTQQADRFIHVRRLLLQEFQKQGVSILLGSDAPQWFNVPGDSLHRELKIMVEYGLTPLQALQTGSKNVHAFYQDKHPVGQIAKGLRADLVLLDRNPLENIENTRSIHAVIVAGKLLDRKALDQLLKSLE